MRISVNGTEREVAAPSLLADLLPSSKHGIAVAVNGEVVPRAELAHRVIDDGDEIEIVTAVQGG